MIAKGYRISLKGHEDVSKLTEVKVVWSVIPCTLYYELYSMRIISQTPIYFRKKIACPHY